TASKSSMSLRLDAATSSVIAISSNRVAIYIPTLCADGLRRRLQREVLVDLRDRRGAFADRRADALRRSRAHVAHREDARDARLERGLRLPGDAESVRVERDPARGEPIRRGIAAEEEEYAVHRPRVLLPARAVAPGD